MTKKNYRTAIVFQGGGAYGAMELGAYKALDELGIEPHVVTGVSIGAINAAVVAGCKNNDPVRALELLWDRLTAISVPGLPNWLDHLISLPYNPGMYTPNPLLYYMPFAVTNYSDTYLLEDTLNELIDWKKLNHPKASIKLAVTALNIKTGKLTVFRNYKEPEKRDNDIGPPITAKHIVASGSLPPAFPMTTINGDMYWDGGLFSNTPLKPAIKGLQAIEDKSENGAEIRRRIIILTLFPPVGEVPGNLAEVDSRKTEIAFQSKIDYDSDLLKKTKTFKSFAELVAAKYPDDPDIRKHEGFQRLMKYKEIDTPIEIGLDKKDAPFTFMPGADFTRETIKSREEYGKKRAREILAAHDL